MAAQKNSPLSYAMPEGVCAYAIGDIHGRFDLLRKIHQRIMEDRATRRAREFLLIYLGDYVDRGPDSREVLELLIQAPLSGFEAVYLKGNHENAMLDFMETRGREAEWLLWGGYITLASYGIAVPDENAPASFRFRQETSSTTEALADALAAHLPEAHRNFLNGLKLNYTLGEYLFVHAGINPARSLEHQLPWDMMAIREEFFRSPATFEKAVVFGHTIFEKPLHLPDRIGIDTGAYKNGTLTALVLEGASRHFLSVC